MERVILNEHRLLYNTFYWDRLWEALKNNTTVTELYTGASSGCEHINAIKDPDCFKLAEALKANNTLEILTLDWHHIGNTGLRLIADALKINKKLRVLWLSHNDFDMDPFSDLGGALAVNTTLTELNLASIGLVRGDPAKFQVFCDALKVNKTLKTLNMEESTLLVEPYNSLQVAIKENTNRINFSEPDPPKKNNESDLAVPAGSDDDQAEQLVKATVKTPRQQLEASTTVRTSSRQAKTAAAERIAPLVQRRTRKKRKGVPDELPKERQAKVSAAQKIALVKKKRRTKEERLAELKLKEEKRRLKRENKLKGEKSPKKYKKIKEEKASPKRGKKIKAEKANPVKGDKKQVKKVKKEAQNGIKKDGKRKYHRKTNSGNNNDTSNKNNENNNTNEKVKGRKLISKRISKPMKPMRPGTRILPRRKTKEESEN
jgi:hypothetical protein